MDYINLGNTGHKVSKMCFGSITIGPLGADLPLQEAAAVVRFALEQGINFIDTAQYYGNYAALRQGLRGFNGQVVMASKSYAQTPSALIEAVEEARRELDRDVIEIFHLHEVREPKLLDEKMRLLSTLADLKNKGLIKTVGISTHSAKIAALAAKVEQVEVIHPMLNKAGVGIIDGSVEDMIAACRLAKANGKGIYGMKALGGGSLAGRAQEMLDWAFSREYVDSFALGMKSECEILNNIAWMEGRPSPCPEQVKHLQRTVVFDENPCYKACGACVAKCSQRAINLKEDNSLKWIKARCVYCGYCIAACPVFNISIV